MGNVADSVPPELRPPGPRGSSAAQSKRLSPQCDQATFSSRSFLHEKTKERRPRRLSSQSNEPKEAVWRVPRLVLPRTLPHSRPPNTLTTRKVQLEVRSATYLCRTIYGILLHLLGHVRILNHGLALSHLAKSSVLCLSRLCVSVCVCCRSRSFVNSRSFALCATREF